MDVLRAHRYEAFLLYEASSIDYLSLESAHGRCQVVLVLQLVVLPLRQAVRGVARSSPGRPQSQDQYIADRNSATGDTSISAPYYKVFHELNRDLIFTQEWQAFS
jgi:hypothetical protein